MSKANRRIHQGLSNQPALFAIDLEEGAFDIALGFRQGLSRAISASGKDRYLIAGEVSRLTRSSFSKDMLDKYCASDPAYGIRAEWLTAFCHATSTMDPFRYLLNHLGADVLNPEDQNLFRLARLEEKKRELDAEIIQLRSKCGIK